MTTPRVTVPVDVVAACKGEQEHFETWAKMSRYDLGQHPLHYIFTDPKTDAARMGWKAALAYVHDAAEPLSAAPAPAEAGEMLDAAEQGRLSAVINMLEPVVENNESVRLYGREVAVLLKALRAQPPAREDAQPVAWRVEYRMPNGRMSGVQLFGTRAAVEFAQEEASQPTTVSALYTHPAPALRVAVKALERIADEAPYRSGYCQSDVEYAPTLSSVEMQSVARQALAALQAEQKGGA